MCKVMFIRSDQAVSNDTVICAHTASCVELAHIQRGCCECRHNCNPPSMMKQRAGLKLVCGNAQMQTLQNKDLHEVGSKLPHIYDGIAPVHKRDLLPLAYDLGILLLKPHNLQ